MKASARYVKIIEWSDEDRCFVGSCPGLFYGGAHGDDEQAVFAELCEIVDDMTELYQKEGRPLPPATCGRDYANKMLNVA
jgi:predicted RNase H-like HicB family nuclease